MNTFKKYDGNLTFNVRFIGDAHTVSLNNVKSLRDYTNRNKESDTVGGGRQCVF